MRFDGTWGRKLLLSYYESLSDIDWQRMSIEQRNFSIHEYESILDSLITAHEFEHC